jgi:peptide/nickel transport system ATP-binding protein/oligopeptide transport system ATP-binding protein
MPEPKLLDVMGLSVRFERQDGWFSAPRVVQAVDDVSFGLAAGETLAIVGESGCGKTTLGRAIIGLIRPNAGQIRWRGVDMAPGKVGRPGIQMIFQDPFGSLNPRFTIAQVIAEPLVVQKIGTKADQDQRVRELLAQVGLSPDALTRHPRQFSGGQRQRIAIARALAPEPQLIIADEPLSALDVSIQSQILNLLADIKAHRQLAFLFISHDLAAVYHIADRVAVMYLGRIVEIGPRERVFSNPAHPYTRALLNAVPRLGMERSSQNAPLPGDALEASGHQTGCAFRPRCAAATALCAAQAPSLRPSTSLDPTAQGHEFACHHGGSSPGEAAL